MHFSWYFLRNTEISIGANLVIYEYTLLMSHILHLLRNYKYITENQTIIPIVKSTIDGELFIIVQQNKI